MKKHFTQRIYLVCALTTLATFGVFAQQLPTTSLYRHGTNSSYVSGPDLAPELTDSVTVGSTLDYFVMPDALYNPLYAPATSLTTGLVSTFTWSSTPAGPSVSTKTGFMTNYVTVVWPATSGTYSVKVVENNTCSDPTGRTIPVAVINKPTANFSATGSTQCTATPATQTFTLPLSLTTDINNGLLTASFQVIYTPVSGAPTNTSYANVALNESGTLKLETLIGSALAYGNYAVKVTAVNDRISVKSNIAGSLGATQTYTYNLIRLPQTGVIYHAPNIQ